MFIFFTDIIRKDVVDRHGRYVGHPCDFISELQEPYPRVTHLVVSRGIIRKTYYIVPWKDVHQTQTRFSLKVPVETLEKKSKYRLPDQTTLRTAVLDQQVVDTFNRKVVRVNDIHFLRVDDDLRLAHVDIGVRGLVRRLGFEKIADAIVRTIHKHSRYLTDEGLISWKYVQPLSIQQATGKIQLTVDAGQLKQIPPPDISSMLMELDPYQRAALIRSLDVQSQVDIITELELRWQKDIVEDLDPRALAMLFERMPADEATDLLSSFSKRDATRMLQMLTPKKAREISELMTHESDSAGGLMTTEFVTLREAMSVGDAIEAIRCAEIQKKAETIHNAFVVDEEHKLIGTVSFRQLLLDSLDAKVCETMQKKPPFVRVDDSVRDVAYLMDKYNLFALPVVDDKGEMEGIITVDDVLHLAVEEAWGKRTGL